MKTNPVSVTRSSNLYKIQKYLKNHDEEMAFVSFYNCSESIRFLQAHEKYNSRTHDEAINKEWPQLHLLTDLSLKK